MKGLAFVAVGVFWGVGPPVTATARAGPVPLEVREVDAAGHPDVSLTVIAPRELIGQEIPASAFAVSEAGQSPELRVERLAVTELEVVLVIDTSGSMEGNPLEAAKAAAVGFVEQMPPSTQTAVIGFGDSPTVASGFTGDVAALTTAIQQLQAAGETAFYDALIAAADQFDANRPARRSIIVLTDGGDTASATAIEDVEGRLALVDTAFHALTLVTSESDFSGVDRLASFLDGRVVSDSDPLALTDLYASIASDLVNQYRIEFTSAAHGPTDVEITLRHDQVVATATETIEFPPAPPSVLRVVDDPGLLADDWALLGGATALFISLLIGGWLVLQGREPRWRMNQVAGSDPITGTEGTHFGSVSTLATRASSLAERQLARHNRGERMNNALERAGVALRPGEFVVLAISSAFVTLTIGLVLAGLVLGVVVAALTLVGFRLALSVRADRRRARFAQQLPDTLQLMAGTMRAGYGLNQATDSVAREAEAPTSDEFQRLVGEIRLGREFSEAFHALAGRMADQDFDWVVEAMDIHREVGGDLAEVLDNVASTIRDRNRIRGQIKALSAEGRLSAIILMVLPFGLIAWMQFSNPEYIGELTGDPLGKILLVIGGLLMIAGGLWMRQIVKPEF